jgi:hypothetical protein
MGSRIIDYFDGHRAITFLAIFVLSLTVRTAILIHFRGDILQVGEEPKIAYALISKGEFADPYAVPTGPTAHSTPFFPVMLAGVYKLLGTGFAGQFGRCMLVVTGYSLLFALYPTFATAFGFPFEAGLIGGFFSALLPVRRSFEVFRGWEESYAAIALALILLFTLRRYQSGDRSPQKAILLGLCWGTAMYIGFSMFSILVGLLLVDVLLHRNLSALRDAVLVMLACFVAMGPWLLRNHHVLHGWTLMRSNFGMELRLANHDYAHPSAEQIYFDPAAMAAYGHPGKSVEQATILGQMGEINYSHYCTRLALNWIAAHPGKFLWLTVQRTAFFWLGPLNHRFEAIVTSAYSLLGFAGLGFIGKRVGKIQFQIWCTVLFFYPLMYYFMVHTTRYRVQIDWMIWLSAGLAIQVLLERFSPSWYRQDARNTLLRAGTTAS